MNRRDETQSIDMYFLSSLCTQVFDHCIPPPVTIFFLFLYYFVYCNRLFYSHLAFPAPDQDWFCLVELLGK